MKSHRPRGQAVVKTWKDYLPLIVLLVVTAVAAVAKNEAYETGIQWRTWMQDFMGYFFVTFATLKLFDLPGFVDGFHMYDLLARAVRPYGYIYPFIELALGLGFLSERDPSVICATTVIVMVFGALGVINALRRGLDLHCACMGNILKVPLSVVALGEDLGMAAMAAGMWLARPT
ncbi:MAG TPA: MauE/DoxX family redox-associated membrane protein [Candidatus Didemnitutus sp.]|jgi:hypothetical protein